MYHDCVCSTNVSLETRETNARHSDPSANLQRTITRLGIIDDGDVNRAARAAKLRDERLRCGAALAYFLNRSGELNVAKKSKKAKRGAPVRKKKGMKKATPAKKKKKPASKPAPAPIAPSPPLWEGFGGKTKDQ